MKKRYIVVVSLMLLPSFAFAGVRFGRDTLKGTTKTQGDFNLTSRFNVEIDGVVIAGVRKITGLEHEHEVVEYQDGDDMVTRFRSGR